MILNDAGKMGETEWLKIPQRFNNIKLHDFVVMPNHFYAILEITVGATLVVAPNGVVAQNATTMEGDHKRGRPQGRATTREGDHKGGRPQGRATTRVAPTVGDMVGAFQSTVR